MQKRKIERKRIAATNKKKKKEHDGGKGVSKKCSDLAGEKKRKGTRER